MSAAIATPGGSGDMSEQVDLSTIPISPEGGNSPAERGPDKDKLVTVFDDKDNFNVIHPLAHKWTLWFTKPPSGKVNQRAPWRQTFPSSIFG